MPFYHPGLMPFLQKTILCLLIPAAAACALSGCADDPRKQGGTYTAARHMSTGSHVPQASDINNANSVYQPAPGQETIANNPALPQGR